MLYKKYPMMRIHFVCLGNTYRSRLAEAFFKSLSIPDWEASSSGALAYMDENGPICWYTKKVLEENNLTEFASEHWADCNPTLFEQADKIILMHPEVIEAYRSRFGEPTKEYEVWDIEDLHTFGMSEEEVMSIARETFGKIKGRVTVLAKELQ